MNPSPRSDRAARVRQSLPVSSVLTIAAVLAVTLAGYAGFRVSAGLDLGSSAGAGVMALAVITGFAAFFSPCSFPLLLGMLTGSDTATAGGRSRREGIATALAMGVGAATFLMLVGAVVGIVGEGVVRSVGFSTAPGRFLRAAVAAVLVGAGLMQLGVVRISAWRVVGLAAPIDRLRAAAAGRHRRLAQMLYGFGFVLAGFG